MTQCLSARWEPQARQAHSWPRLMALARGALCTCLSHGQKGHCIAHIEPVRSVIKGCAARNSLLVFLARAQAMLFVLASSRAALAAQLYNRIAIVVAEPLPAQAALRSRCPQYRASYHQVST